MSEETKKQDTFRRVEFNGDAGQVQLRLTSVPGYIAAEPATGLDGAKEIRVTTPSGDTIVLKLNDDGSKAVVQNVLDQDVHGAPLALADDESVRFANAVDAMDDLDPISTVEASNRDRGISGKW